MYTFQAEKNSNDDYIFFNSHRDWFEHWCEAILGKLKKEKTLVRVFQTLAFKHFNLTPVNVLMFGFLKTH